MYKKSTFKLKSLLLAGLATMLVGAVIFYLSSQVQKAETSISLIPDDPSVIKIGKSIYAKNCASCHGVALEGQANWKQRDIEGYMPAPPHDMSGHTWHHADPYLFLMTKYGIEEMIGKKYPNNMPAYENVLTDDAIIAVLSYIKSTWPSRIQRQHSRINASVNTQ
jgi:S-disulfanyl-L-cysteine oxidoreductase SoxD